MEGICNEGVSDGRREGYSLFPTRKAEAQGGGHRFRKLKATTVSALWATSAALAIVFSSWLPAAPTDVSTSPPQIQGEHLRIHFDHYLHSRVVARFDGKETAMGPFVASERVAIADKTWSGFSLVSQKNERVSDAFGAGERLIVLGKSGLLTKEVTVTIYGMNAIDYGLLEVRPQ